MTPSRISIPESESSPRSQGMPIVYVVDVISPCASPRVANSFRSWQPETFASAQEFLVTPRAMVPNCLNLDVSLPGLTGLELQERVAAERTERLIIFITWHGDVPMTVKAMKKGAVEFLTNAKGRERGTACRLMIKSERLADPQNSRTP
jgi:FixJ family two-component response regulator